VTAASTRERKKRNARQKKIARISEYKTIKGLPPTENPLRSPHKSTPQQTPLESVHFTSISFMVVTKKVQDAVDQKLAELCLRYTVPSLGVVRRDLGGDDNFPKEAETFVALPLVRKT
jgi:hypothetical protein